MLSEGIIPLLPEDAGLGVVEGTAPVSSGGFRQDWMRALPSGFVISGCSFGVAKVYTLPVSEATSNNTCVPVSVLSS